MENKISVIIPIYNAEKWLKECIESVIQQTYKDLDIVLIDDGSTDKSASICDEYAQKDNRINVIHKKNEGVSIARNTGIKNAKGEFIKFVDSDDWLEKECCEKLINIIKKEDVDLVICGLNIYKNKQLLRTPHLEDKKLSIRDSIDNFKYISKVFASPCNKLFKKEFIRELFKEDQTAGEDLLFNLSYLKEIKTLYATSYCLYNVRLDNENSLNRKFREDRLDICLNLVKKQIEFCDEIYGEYDRKFLYNSYIENVHSHFRNLAKEYKYKEYKNKIQKYLKNADILIASKMCELTRKDYKVFNQLLKLKNKFLIYSFFKVKILITKK